MEFVARSIEDLREIGIWQAWPWITVNLHDLLWQGSALTGVAEQARWRRLFREDAKAAEAAPQRAGASNTFAVDKVVSVLSKIQHQQQQGAGDDADEDEDGDQELQNAHKQSEEHKDGKDADGSTKPSHKTETNSTMKTMSERLRRTVT